MELGAPQEQAVRAELLADAVIPRVLQESRDWPVQMVHRVLMVRPEEMVQSQSLLNKGITFIIH